MPHGWAPLAALPLVAALLLAGCGADGRSSSATTSTAGNPATSTSQANATSSSQSPAEAAVLAGWEAFWADWIAVSATADYRSPRLAEHATGEALRRLRLQLLSYNREGLVARGKPVRTRTRVLAVDARKARVAECLDSSRWQAVDAETGKPSGTPSGKNRQVRAELTRTEGRWKVSELDIRESLCVE